MELLQSDRLDLVPISVPELLELAKEPSSFFLFKLRAPLVMEDESNNRWLFRRIFLRSIGVQIGLISFHGLPDEIGMLEIGLDINENFRNQGYATEAIRCLWCWAANQPEVKILRYTVSSRNLPSMRIIEKFGFHHVGQQFDPEDGPEEIFEMMVDEYRKLHCF